MIASLPAIGLLAIFGSVAYWLYSLAVYDWSRYEQDQAQAKQDFC